MIHDRRGQSQVLGAMLIFAFLVGALGIYQAFIVPQQTGDVELEHAGEVKDDFTDVHGAITNAGATNGQRTTNVKLGTRYPSRIFALNPPPVHGRIALDDLGGEIRFTGNGSFTAADICGNSFTSPKELTYDADYNVLTDTGHHGYETSVTYHGVENRLVSSDQVLVQGTTIQLLPLTNGSISMASVESQSLEFHGGVTGGTTEHFEPVIEIPTALNQTQWEEILEDEDKFVSVSVSNGRAEITLEADEYTVRCTPIGEGVTPENAPTLVPGSGSGSGGGGFAINPNGPNAVVYESDTTIGSNGVSVTFRNKDDDRTRIIEEARVPFYNAEGQGNTGSDAVEDVQFFDSPPDEPIGGPFADIGSHSLSPNGQNNVRIDFFCGNGNDFSIAGGDYFVLTLLFADGQQNNYFIAPNGGSSGNRCGGQGQN